MDIVENGVRSVQYTYTEHDTEEAGGVNQQYCVWRPLMLLRVLVRGDVVMEEMTTRTT